jgi:hypothetical protein
VPKKRVIMKQEFPDYKNLMKKDLAKWEKETENLANEADFSININAAKGSQVIRKSCRSQEPSSALPKIENLSVNEDEKSNEEKDFSWKTSNNSFSFNFNV